MTQNPTRRNMIYPDHTVESWIKKYPALADYEPFCECDSPNIQPYMTYKSVGIACRACNTGLWTMRKEEDNQKWLNVLMEPMK